MLFEDSNPLAKWFGGDKKKEEKSAGGELVAGIDALLKDAPLPVKMLGGMMKPLVQGMGQMIAESANDAGELQDAALRALRMDSRAVAALGRDISSGGVFSTSSSSSSINGRTQKRIQLSFSVLGSGGQQGMATVLGTASDGSAIRIDQLQLQANGQVINVSGGGGGGGNGGGGNDGVIDVEVVG